MKGVALGLLVLCVLWTWPLVIAPAAAYSGRQDYYLGLWDLWWVAEAATRSDLEVFHTPMLFHPFGTSLAVQPLTLLQTLTATPFTKLLGPAVTYNLLVFLSFWCAGWFTAAWVRELTGSLLAAWVAGIAFAFSPFHYAYIGQLNVVAIGVLPLYLWAGLRFTHEPGTRRAIAAGVALAAVALVSWYFAVGAGIIGIVTSARRLLRGGTRASRRFALELLHWGSAALLVAPAVLEVLGSFSGARYSESPTRAGLALVMENFNGTGMVLGLWTWCGISVLLLACASGAAGGTAKVLWGLALGALLLAFGDTLTLGSWELPMPYRLLDSLPVVRGLRYPARFFVFAHLGLAALAGQGTLRLARSGPGGGRRFATVATAASCAILAEFWPGPLPSRPLPEPLPIPAASAVAASEGAVLHLPVRFRNYDGELMFQQLAHRRPILGGYLTRPNPRLVRRTRSDPYFGSLIALEPGEIPADLARGLAELGVAYVCVQKAPALDGFPREPFRAFGPFCLAAPRFLRQRLFPAYEQQRLMRPEAAAPWIAALRPLLGPPIHEDARSAIFEVRGERDAE